MIEPANSGETLLLEPNDTWNWWRDLLAFAVTIACAIIFKWTARDVIWGLWICSLVVGYSFIVWTLVTSVLKTPQENLGVALVVAVFLLPFFTIHFGIFHFVQGVFLNMFFPFAEGRQTMNIAAMVPSVIGAYWPLILTTYVSRASDFRDKYNAVTSDPFNKNALVEPYANVVRMHILIFVFAGLHITGLSGLALFPALAFYFVPWNVLRKLFRKPAAGTVAATPPGRPEV